METSPAKNERVASIFKIGAGLLVGAEMVRTVRRAKKTGHIMINRETGAFMYSLMRDDVKRIAEITGLVRSNGDIDVETDNMQTEELDEITDMLPPDNPLQNG